MFSNTTEAMSWQERNCYKCKQYESESETIDQAKCPTAFEIDLGYIIGELPSKTKKIINKKFCTLRK